MAKQQKPQTVSERIIESKHAIGQALMGAEMGLLNGKDAKFIFDTIKPILDEATRMLQGASNLLHGYPVENENE